ncbi:MAG: DNA-directed RNA polymerase subunit omega [bacterium]|nr:DNA-directed RNA polymerase subunit omega [bacterium]
MEEKFMYVQEDLLKQFDSLYEAVMVLSIRARQIGNNQLEAIKALQKQMATVDVIRENTLDDDFDLSEPRDPIELPRFEKPTVAAIKEAMSNSLVWSYVEPKEDDEFVLPQLAETEIEKKRSAPKKVLTEE